MKTLIEGPKVKLIVHPKTSLKILNLPTVHHSNSGQIIGGSRIAIIALFFMHGGVWKNFGLLYLGAMSELCLLFSVKLWQFANSCDFIFQDDPCKLVSAAHDMGWSEVKVATQ